MTTHDLRNRVYSIDILRGLVIVLMAIDHTRDMWSLATFAPEDMTQTTAGYFFTRWITHFCAPIFVFLAGTAVCLYYQKVKNKKLLSGFLLKRGLWLILIEIIVINWSWGWDFFWNQWGFFLQVLWVIGIAMIAMAGLIWLSYRNILIISLLMIFGHNLLDGISPEQFGSFDWLWNVLHVRGWIPLNEDGSFGIFMVYPAIPWIGVMGAGYVFGNVMSWSSERRTKFLYQLGLGSIALFIILRFSNLYGDTGDWETQKNALFTVMSFLNTQKYPPSLLFLLMTIGPAFLLLIFFEKWQSKSLDFLRVFGRVPFFFYVLHFSVIHAASILYFKLAHGQWFDLANTGAQNWPEFYTPSLLRMYIAWVVIVIGFYFLCKWYDGYKSQHSYWWLKYT